MVQRCRKLDFDRGVIFTDYRFGLFLDSGIPNRIFLGIYYERSFWRIRFVAFRNQVWPAVGLVGIFFSCVGLVVFYGDAWGTAAVFAQAESLDSGVAIFGVGYWIFFQKTFVFSFYGRRTGLATIIDRAVPRISF